MVAADPAVVDEQVDWSEPLPDLGISVQNLRAVTHIQRECHDSHPVSRLQSGCLLLQQALAARGQDQLHPLAGQSLGNGQPDAAGTTGDQGASCSQCVHLVLLLNGVCIVAGDPGRGQGRRGEDSNPGSYFGAPVRTLVLARPDAGRGQGRRPSAASWMRGQSALGGTGEAMVGEVSSSLIQASSRV